MQFDQLKRREFITLLEGAAASSVCWPLAARAQEPGRAYHFGTLHSAPRFAPHHIAFFDELRRLGFLEGQNLRVDVVDRIRVRDPPRRQLGRRLDTRRGRYVLRCIKEE
jgi:hypothetical protein